MVRVAIGIYGSWLRLACDTMCRGIGGLARGGGSRMWYEEALAAQCLAVASAGEVRRIATRSSAGADHPGPAQSHGPGHVGVTFRRLQLNPAGEP